jgi:hypothetical protein
MNQMRKAHNPRRAILIISDGGDNASRYAEREIKNAVRESDVQLYAIGIYEPPESRSRTPEEAQGPELLNELAQRREEELLLSQILPNYRMSLQKSELSCGINTCSIIRPKTLRATANIGAFR